MAHCCNRVHSLGDGYSLFAWQEPVGTGPAPTARSFALPGAEVQFPPDRPADVKHVKLDISLDFDQETVSGTAYTTFSALFEEVTSVTFDAIELHIDEVTLVGGGKLAYSVGEKQLVVTLDRVYQHGEEFTVAISYHARPRIGLNFVKPAPEEPGRFTHCYSFHQPQYAAYWFPCHNCPNDRATTEILVTAPAQYIAIANGNLLEVKDNGATKTHHWLHSVPHASYLLSLVVGDFAVVEDTFQGMPVTYYVRKDRVEDARLLMGKTPEMIRFFSEFIGVDYPYDNYKQTVVELYTGAMEHTTTTTHSFSLLLDQRAALDMRPDYEAVVAHELAHQWFGDLVTCRDWSNTWLNEGFASYFDQLWGEHDLGKDYFKYSMHQEMKSYQNEDKHYRRPIVYNVWSNEGWEMFDAHTYKKGEWVLHMLRHQLGEKAFRRAINYYLQRNRTREVVTADLQRALEESTGRSLEQFFQQWVYHGGYPEFEVQYNWDRAQKLAKVVVKQTQKIDDLTPCFAVPVELAFTIPASDEAAKDPNTTDTRTLTLRVVVGEGGQTEQAFFFPLEREPLMVRFDPDGWVLKTLQFRLPTNMLCYQLAHDPDVLGRIEAIEALAERSEPEALKALETALLQDSFYGVRAEAAAAIGKQGTDQAQDILIRALQELDPHQQPQARAAIATALGEFQAPVRKELAERSAQVLKALLEKGDPSYRVESSAAAALGKTRVEGSVDALYSVLDRSSWLYIVHSGIFTGMGASGDERVVDTLCQYLGDKTNYVTLRRYAAAGLGTVGSNKFLYSEEVRQRAVTALCQAVEHDSWAPTRTAAARALLAFGEKRAIPVLERAAEKDLDESVKRVSLSVAVALKSADGSEEQLKQLRKDLEEIREENRKLRERLSALDARLS